jgi:hypothetical protein
MNKLERVQFIDAMREVARLIKLTQAALQRARSQCHGELYEQAHLMSMRVYEQRVRSDWLVYAGLGVELPLGSANPDGRQGTPDRRTAVDRRIQGMQQRMLPLARPELPASAFFPAR